MSNLPLVFTKARPGASDDVVFLEYWGTPIDEGDAYVIRRIAVAPVNDDVTPPVTRDEALQILAFFGYSEPTSHTDRP